MYCMYVVPGDRGSGVGKETKLAAANRHQEGILFSQTVASYCEVMWIVSALDPTTPLRKKNNIKMNPRTAAAGL